MAVGEDIGSDIKINRFNEIQENGEVSVYG